MAKKETNAVTKVGAAAAAAVVVDRVVLVVSFYADDSVASRKIGRAHV